MRTTHIPSETAPAPRWAGVLRTRWTLWVLIGALVAVVIAAGVIIPLAIADHEHAAAVNDYTAEQAQASAAADDLSSAAAARAAAADAGTADVAALNGVLEALPAELVDPASTRDAVAAAATTIQTAVTASEDDSTADAADPVDVDVTTATTADLTNAAAQERARADALRAARETIQSRADTITTARADAGAPLAALVAAAVAKAPGIPIDRAGDAERAAVATALDALRPAAASTDAAVTDVLGLVKTYAAAVAAARSSHDAAIAAEQEAQRQAQENSDAGASGGGNSSGGGSSSSRGSNGGGGSNSAGGGNSGGSSGGSSNGSGSGNSGSSGGDGSSGGGNSGPVSQPLKLVKSGSCTDSDIDGQSASYGSTLHMPSDAAWYETYEIPGYGWGVRWSCF